VPAGFTVEMIASDVKNPRVVRVAPNGDLKPGKPQRIVERIPWLR
jgi:hypothetical protein